VKSARGARFTCDCGIWLYIEEPLLFYRFEVVSVAIFSAEYALRLASYITSRWIRRNADEQSNPFRPTPENLKAGQDDFGEHCAGCHGLTGSGENRLEADFYPPIPKLTGDTQKWSDGELYFIIPNGICMTAMPGFGKKHDPKEIWGMI
jgi:mono/diheme cytochrome c family protein